MYQSTNTSDTTQTSTHFMMFYPDTSGTTCTTYSRTLTATSLTNAAPIACPDDPRRRRTRQPRPRITHLESTYCRSHPAASAWQVAMRAFGSR